MFSSMLTLTNTHFDMNGPKRRHVSYSSFRDGICSCTQHIGCVRAIGDALLDLLFCRQDDSPPSYPV